MRAHRMYFQGPVMLPGVFKDHGNAMSVDWDEHATPEDTQARARSPEDNAVISLEAGEVRHIEGLSVTHEPEDDNRAHSGVHGDKDEETRVRLRRIASEVIPLHE
jgi:hypothetical protein